MLEQKVFSGTKFYFFNYINQNSEERLNKKYTSTIEDICCLVKKLDLKVN